MAGPPVALDTLGGRTAFEISAFGMVLAALMNLFLVTRHLRGDEEAGRAELLRSTVVGRHASITAVLATALLADAVLGGLLFAVLIGTGLPAGGSARSEEHTSELQSLMRISYAVFCLKKK